MPLVGLGLQWIVLKAHALARAPRLSAWSSCDLAMTSQSDTLTEIKFDPFVPSENNSIGPLKARPKGAYDARAAPFWCEQMSIVATRDLRDFVDSALSRCVRPDVGAGVGNR